MANDPILSSPSKKTVYFLYNGLVQFYPDLVFGEEGKKRGYKNHWGGFERTEFLEFLFNITEKDSDIEAKNKVTEWINLIENGEYPKETIPQNINDLVEDWENLEENNKENERLKLKERTT